MFPLKDTIPSYSIPFITWVIIAINCLVFFFEMSLSSNSLEGFFNVHGVVPVTFLGNLSPQEIGTVISSMFLHGGWAHLLGNMWFLYIFGDNVEDRLGHFGYVFFYIFTGTVAAATQIFASPHSHVAMIGASGAISGVLGAYFAYYPQAKVVTLMPMGVVSRVVELPALVFLGFWFALQFFSGVTSLGAAAEESGGVAFWAHVGGFVAGFLVAKVFAGKEPPQVAFDY
jgi:membrane associated rhomboid family serine protease